MDGVLRIFGSYVLGYEPENWNDIHSGKSIIEIVNENPEICAYCPESEYLPIVNKRLNNINILTNQLPSWIPFTELWLNKHIKIPYDVVYTKNSNHKLTYLNKNDILVEDFPGFSSYNNIALITRNYNKNVVVPIRISNTEEFNRFLDDHVNN